MSRVLMMLANRSFFFTSPPAWKRWETVAGKDARKFLVVLPSNCFPQHQTLTVASPAPQIASVAFDVHECKATQSFRKFLHNNLQDLNPSFLGNLIFSWPILLKLNFWLLSKLCSISMNLHEVRNLWTTTPTPTPPQSVWNLFILVHFYPNCVLDEFRGIFLFWSISIQIVFSMEFRGIFLFWSILGLSGAGVFLPRRRGKKTRRREKNPAPGKKNPAPGKKKPGAGKKKTRAPESKIERFLEIHRN